MNENKQTVTDAGNAPRGSIMSNLNKTEKVSSPEKNYIVTVIVEGNSPYTVTVKAPREGLAKTRAMVSYPYKLSGQLVEYKVEEAS